MLIDLQKRAAQAIINIFETSKVLGDYTSVVSVPGDPGGLTYGKSQTTLNSGNLFLLIKDYCEAEGAAFANELNPYLERLADEDSRLNHDTKLHNMLRKAGSDPVMQDVQDAFFDRVYWNPAVKQATNLGVSTPLGTAVVYDSTVHGSWGIMRDRTIERFGKVSDIGEQQWITHYVDIRRNWLATHSTVRLLRKTVYRMDAFQKLITAANWDLTLPFNVRGLLIDEETLTPTSSSSAEVNEIRLLRLKRPFMQGEDVRKVQEALKQAGIAVEVDDIYGSDTEAAVKEFQKKVGLKPDGIVGPVTRSELGL
jgi:chitosanase